MKLFRYRRPSLNTVSGIPTAGKQVKKELGITAAMKRFGPGGMPSGGNGGWKSETGRLIRNGLPRPGGVMWVVVDRATATQCRTSGSGGEGADRVWKRLIRKGLPTGM